MTPGRHQVQIRVRDQDANVSEVFRSPEIVVLPPIWLRPWFLVSCGVIIALLGWQSVLVVVQGIDLRRSNRELKTARAQLEGRFAEQTARFRAVCDCSRIGIFVTDTDGEVQYVNHSLRRLCGIPADANSGHGWAQGVHPDDRDRILHSWENAFSELMPFECTGRFLGSDGSITWFDMVADRVGSNGKFLGYMGVVEDVTRRKRDSEELKASNARLQEAIEQLRQAQDQAIKRARLSALGQMAAGVAHDVNNSLAPLLTYAELLARDDEIRGASRQWVELIRLGVSDTAETVKRLDHFYRKSHDRDFLERVDLAETVSQVVELTRPKWQDASVTEHKTIKIHIESTTNPVIYGNSSQIRSVLTNLIFNAVDAIEEQGNVVIRVDQSGEHATIEVADDGSGMTSQQRDCCLELFFTTKSDGSGMGLAECEGVVRQHGGHIVIASERGQGTQVTLTFPLAKKYTGRDDVSENRRDRLDRPHDHSQDRSGVPTTAAVLYVDDDPAVRMSTVAIMTALGVHVETAEDGPTALHRMEQQDFQLVICDQGLPGMDGIEVLQEIKRRRPDLPVVIISGWSLRDISEGAKPDDFLEKPVAFDDLVAVLQRYLPMVGATPPV